MPEESMSYKVDREAKRFHYIITAGLIAGLLFAIHQILTGDDVVGKFFISIWAAGIIFGLQYIIRQPNEIEFDKISKQIRFKSNVRAFSYRVSSLQRIEVNNQYISFIFENQKVLMPHQITGLHILVADLKEVKSNLTIKGC